MTALPTITPAVDFPDVYETLLWRILRHGHVERNERTGKEVRVYPGGPTSFTLDLSSGLLPVPGNRKVFPGTAAAETAWFLTGTRDAEFMLRHAKVVWEKFVEPHPSGTGGPVVKAAYGYRWRRHFKRDQLFLAIKALRDNPSDRRIWISAWDPSEDGLGARGQLNVPCPVGFTLSIQDGRLNSSYLLRSSDVFVGLPYDVMGHAMLMDVLAYELGVQLGTMHFTLAHPHVYDVHWEMAGESLRGSKVKSVVRMTNRGHLMALWPVDLVEQDPDGFVETYRALAAKAEWPEFHCRPEVVQ